MRHASASVRVPACRRAVLSALAVAILPAQLAIEASIRMLNEGPISLRDLWGQEIR